MHDLLRILILAACASAAALASESPAPPAEASNSAARAFGRWVEILPQSPTNKPRGLLDADAVNLTPAQKLLYDTTLLVQDGDYTNAIPRLENVIDLDPSLVAAWADLGWSYWKTGRLTEAEALWKKLRTLNPKSATPYNLLAQIELSRNGIETAESLLQKSLAIEPGQYEIRFALALALAWQARAYEALPLLEELVREEPDRVDIRIELGKTLKAVQRYEDAAAHWRIVCETLPDIPEHRREYAACLLYSGDIDLARENARQAAAQDGGAPASLTLLADVAEVADQPEDAVTELRSLIAKSNDPLSRSRLRQRLTANLRRLYDRDPKRFPVDLIVEECRHAIDEDPRYVVMQMLLGEAYVMTRRFTDAERVFTRILEEQNSLNYRAQRGLLEVSLGLGRFEEARRRIDGLYKGYNAGNPYRFVDRARLEFAIGNYPDAIRHLDLLEREGLRGSVLCLGYNTLSATDWEPGLSSRLFRDQLLTLSRAGFRFIAPDQIDRTFALNKTPSTFRAQPWPGRLMRWFKYQFTGQTPRTEALRTLEDYRPERLVCVSFDGAFRNAFLLATPVARELDVPLAMHIPVGGIARRDTGSASWDEIRESAASGVWSFGSFGVNANLPLPGAADGYTVNPLPNRLWLPEQARMETLHDWTLRLRQELRDSRRTVLDQLKLDPGEALHVAYPLGDIGQQGGCNMRELGSQLNVPSAILNEAALSYRVGFIPDPFGYAMAADNSLAFRRHEPGPRDTGQELLRHALDNHPVFLARRMKAELAALQGKNSLAHRMIELLDRDGYPVDLLRGLRDRVEASLGGTVPGEKIEQEPGKGEGDLRLSKPFLGAEAWADKANRQIEVRGAGVFAGLNLSPSVKLEAGFRRLEVEQEAVTSEWVVIRRASPYTDRTSEITIENGAITRSSLTFITVQQQDVYSNKITRARFDSVTLYPGLRLSRVFPDGSVLGGRFGVCRFEGDEEDGTDPVWGADHFWKLAPAFSLASAYTRELVPSGRRPIVTDSLALHGVWAARDNLAISAFGRFSYYADTNSMLHLQASSLWTVDDRQSVALGLQGELTTMDDSSTDYWSPYWEQRLYGVARLSRAYPAFYARAECKLGWAREEARPEDEERWKAIRARGEQLGFYPGKKPGTDWEPSVALGGAFRRTLAKQWEIGLDGACSFYSDYSDYHIGGVLTYHFR